MPDVAPEAEPLSVAGGPVGCLVIHGFTGNPSSMRPIADAIVADGHSVELPRLPGHGTTVEDMNTTSWADWTAEVEASYQRLAARCDHVIAMGLSMGGTLTAWIAAEHPEIRSEEHTSELQSLMRISYAGFCLKKKKHK